MTSHAYNTNFEASESSVISETAKFGKEINLKIRWFR